MNGQNLPHSDDPNSHYAQMGVIWLIAAAVATVVLWQMPWGNYILYPFTILATWFHEMGHGLSAIALGGNFKKLLIFSNGSGLAYHDGPLFLGPVGRALVATGGPLGPAIAGAGLILSSRRFQTAHYSLMFLSSLLLISALLWVRSLFGLLAIPLWGLLILTIALKTKRSVQGATIQFLGVQAIVSTYHQLDYLFTRETVINGQHRLSDTSQIAQQLLLPYWFWASLITVVTLLLLLQSLRLAYRN
jgi:hypothetical protein